MLVEKDVIGLSACLKRTEASAADVRENLDLVIFNLYSENMVWFTKNYNYVINCQKCYYLDHGGR